jgi:hypothetical protein
MEINVLSCCAHKLVGVFYFKAVYVKKKSYVVSQKELIEGVLSKASKFKKGKKWTRWMLRRFVKFCGEGGG